MHKDGVLDDDIRERKRNVRMPEMCVDYLSYTFDEMDLAASWRVMTNQKKDLVDGIRLENASWRTWAKQRYNLKTVSPQTLNWLKDSDVTWLFGPLHTVIKAEEDAARAQPHGLQSSASLVTRSLKPALKRYTLAESLRRSTSQLSDMAADHTHREFGSNPVITLPEASAVPPRLPRTKLRFNHQVEQCIVVTTDDEEEAGSHQSKQFSLDHHHRNCYSVSVSSNSESESEHEPDLSCHAGLMMKPSRCRRSFVKIKSARLKRPQSSTDTDDQSSLSPASPDPSPHMSPTPLHRAVDTTTPAVPIVNAAPTSSVLAPTSSTSSAPVSEPIVTPLPMRTPAYAQKALAAEPALTTTTCLPEVNPSAPTDANQTSDSLLSQLLHWTSHYLWSPDLHKKRGEMSYSRHDNLARSTSSHPSSSS